MPIRTRITTELIEYLKKEFRLEWNGIHGAGHWARVRYTGLLLARSTGANPRLVELFAFLHDSQRLHDGGDSGHGRRAAESLAELEGRLFRVDRLEMGLLELACRHHSDGELDADPTVQTCWDADRLDLGRLGIRPNPSYLCTPAAREPDMIESALRRSRAMSG